MKGVLFDIDGTLVDSNDQHAKAFEEAFAGLGYQVPFSQIRPLIGMGGDKLVPDILGQDVTNEVIEAVGKAKTRIFLEKYLSTVEPFRGVAELFDCVERAGRKIAIASSAGKSELQNLLKIARVEKYLDAKTSGEDAEESKPAPDILQAALEKIQLAPSQVWMVGDTPYDIEASARAGIKCLAVRCGGWDNRALHAAERIFDGPWDLNLRTYLAER